MWKMHDKFRRRFVVTVCALITLGFGLTGAASLRGPRRVEIREPQRLLHPEAEMASSQDSRKVITIETERVTLRRAGFEPAEFSRHKGPFLLSIDNVSELGEMNFQLLRQNGPTERELHHKQDKFRLRQVVDLPPGRYVLTETSHPAWQCQITITAQ